MNNSQEFNAWCRLDCVCFSCCAKLLQVVNLIVTDGFLPRSTKSLGKPSIESLVVWFGIRNFHGLLPLKLHINPIIWVWEIIPYNPFAPKKQRSFLARCVFHCSGDFSLGFFWLCCSWVRLVMGSLILRRICCQLLDFWWGEHSEPIWSNRLYIFNKLNMTSWQWKNKQKRHLKMYLFY